MCDLELVLDYWLELGYMENWVDMGKVLWKLQLVSKRARTSDDFERTKILLGELLCRSSRFDMFSENKNLRSNRKLQCSNSLAIGLFFITFLSGSNFLVEESVNLV